MEVGSRQLILKAHKTENEYTLQFNNRRIILNLLRMLKEYLKFTKTIFSRTFATPMVNITFGIYKYVENTLVKYVEEGITVSDSDKLSTLKEKTLQILNAGPENHELLLLSQGNQLVKITTDKLTHYIGSYLWLGFKTKIIIT